MRRFSLVTIKICDVRLNEQALLSLVEKNKDCNYHMITNPSIMLLDEPTTALDQKSIDVLLTLLKKVKQDHIIYHIKPKIGD